MDEKTANRLVELNRKFYEDFGAAFAATRRRIQPGVSRVLAELPDRIAGFPDSNWLDIGCGSGSLAYTWLQRGIPARYTGADFSTQLLREAERYVSELGSPVGGRITFHLSDLSRLDWHESLPASRYDGVFAFAVLHHIPDGKMRQRVLAQVRDILPEGGWFIHSEWQFHHSPRWMARIQPWELAGISADDVEEGDTLLDWRHTLPGQEEKTGLRYVHLFSREELAELAEVSGFEVIESFSSDGKEGNLGYYQYWRAKAL